MCWGSAVWGELSVDLSYPHWSPRMSTTEKMLSGLAPDLPRPPAGLSQESWCRADRRREAEEWGVCPGGTTQAGSRVRRRLREGPSRTLSVEEKSLGGGDGLGWSAGREGGTCTCVRVLLLSIGAHGEGQLPFGRSLPHLLPSITAVQLWGLGQRNFIFILEKKTVLSDIVPKLSSRNPHAYCDCVPHAGKSPCLTRAGRSTSRPPGSHEHTSPSTFLRPRTQPPFSSQNPGASMSIKRGETQVVSHTAFQGRIK